MFQFRQQLTGFLTKVSHQSLLLLPMALGEYGTNESRKIKSLLVNKSERKKNLSSNFNKAKLNSKKKPCLIKKITAPLLTHQFSKAV